MGNPFLDRADGRIGDSGRASEKRVLNRMGARQHPGSGAPRGAKSDGTLTATRASFRIETKSTIDKSMRIEMGWLSKITAEAVSHGQYPALGFSFVTEEGKGRMSLNSDWVAMPLAVFKHLVGEG